MTSKLKMQVAPAANVTFEKLTLAGLKKVVPTTQLSAILPLTAVTPAGKVSVTETLVRPETLGLLMVRTTFEVPPARIVDGVKDFVIVGASSATVNVAVAVPLGTASTEVTVEVVLT